MNTVPPMTPAQTSAPEPPKIHRIFSALLVLGVSGAGKTSLLKTFADYLWETHRKILLLYSWDGGAIPTDIQKGIHQGLIRFWRVRTRSAPGLALETLHFATRGWWPRRIDPTTGETTPAVDLVAPVTTKYECYAPDGSLLMTVPTPSLIKPALHQNVMVQPHEMTVKEIVSRTKGFELVGGVAFDGLTSMSNVVMDFQDQQRGAGLIGGEKSSFGGVVRSGSISYGGNNRADVGFAQTRANQFVNNSLSIPFLVESPVFTGLSTEGTDKGGLSIIGVDLPGQAALTQAPQWFGNIVEADRWSDEEGKEHYVLNTQPFTDNQGRRHLLKCGSTPWGIPARLVDPARGEGKPFSQFNLGVVFKLLDEDLVRALATDDLSGVPGLSAGVMEYGDPARIEAGTVAGPVSPSRTPVAAAPQARQAGNPGTPAVPAAQAPNKAPHITPSTALTASEERRASTSAPVSPSAAVGKPIGSAPPPPPGRAPARAPGSAPKVS